MKKSVLLFLILGCFQLLAQTPDAPFGNKENLDQIEGVVFPLMDNKILLEEEMALRQTKARPPRFAKAIPVHITPGNSGTWTSIDNDMHVWRIMLVSPNAKSLNLGFSRFFLPPGASMFLYSPDLKQVSRAFTAEDNDAHGQLWTPVLPTDELVVEIQLSENNIDQLQVELSKVNHDFEGFLQQTASGSCNLDVICGAADGWPEVDNYRDIINSVAVYSIGGTLSCTGFLINNTAQDCKPYFLTANHCGLNANNASTIVAYWNFENSFCRQPLSGESGSNGDGILDINNANSGAFFKAGYSGSDFCLLEFDDPVSELANAFMVGWNATDEVPQSSLTIHHPSTDEKRISFENDPSYRGNWATDDQSVPDGDHLIVADWDVGTTEGGSSGSPLFNSNKQAVGQLHGGFAACSNNEYDSYGFFFSSWTGGGTPDSRLSDWLDPTGAGVLQLDGKNCAFNLLTDIPYQEICTDQTAQFSFTASDNFLAEIQLSVNGLPEDVVAVFQPNPVQPGATATLELSNFGNVNPGSYDFLVSGTDETEQATTSLRLQLFNTVFSTINLNNPANNSNNITTLPVFSWENQENITSYTLQIATDENFSNITEHISGITEGTFALQNSLTPETAYFWRISGENICGTSEWSPAFTFQTNQEVCLNTGTDNLGLQIGPNPSTITSEIEVAENGLIMSTKIRNLTGTHTWISDLIFSITSPSGTTVNLITNLCYNEDDFNINFADNAPSADIPCPFNDGGTYQPQNSLAAFNGENQLGTWTLAVQDTEFADGGQLDSWSLELCSTPVSSNEEINPVAKTIQFQVVPNPNSGFAALIFNKNIAKHIQVEILTTSGISLFSQRFQSSSKIELDLNNYPSGIYLVKVKTAQQILTDRIILKK